MEMKISAFGAIQIISFFFAIAQPQPLKSTIANNEQSSNDIWA